MRRVSCWTTLTPQFRTCLRAILSLQTSPSLQFLVSCDCTFIIQCRLVTVPSVYHTMPSTNFRSFHVASPQYYSAKYRSERQDTQAIASAQTVPLQYSRRIPGSTNVRIVAPRFGEVTTTASSLRSWTRRRQQSMPSPKAWTEWAPEPLLPVSSVQARSWPVQRKEPLEVTNM